MPQKHIAVVMRRGPVGTNGPAEGIRAAMGLTAGTEENSVSCVLCDDAVYFALAGHDRGAAQKHLEAVLDTGAVVQVDEDALRRRQIDASHIDPVFRISPTSDVRRVIANADATLVF